MYVFLKEGPIHICKHRDREDTMLVRGWSKEAILRFQDNSYEDGEGVQQSVGMTWTKERFPIWYDEDADYYWRCEMPTPAVARSLAAATSRIQYDSLKAGVAEDGNQEYYYQLVRIHELEKSLLDEREKNKKMEISKRNLHYFYDFHNFCKKGECEHVK